MGSSRNRSIPPLVATQISPSRSSKRLRTTSPERPPDFVNASARPRCSWMSPRSTVPIQRPPSRSRSSLFAVTSRCGKGRFGSTTPRIRYASTLSPVSCLSPAVFEAIIGRPSPVSLRSVIRTPGITYRLGGPGFHRQSPNCAPAQRLPELSSRKLQTNSPKAPSSPWHWAETPRIAQRRPRIGALDWPPTHTVPSWSSSSDATKYPSFSPLLACCASSAASPWQAAAGRASQLPDKNSYSDLTPKTGFLGERELRSDSPPRHLRR